MGLAYGTRVRDYPDLAAAEQEAIARHSHYYADPAGWLIRAEPVRYAACAVTVWGGEDYYTTDAQIELFAFPVGKWTEHGATLQDIWSGARRRWVDLRPGAKQWASRTAADAVQQLALRRSRMIWVLERKLDRAKGEQQLAELTLKNCK